MKAIILVALLCPLLSFGQTLNSLDTVVNAGHYRIHYSKKDKAANKIQEYVESGLKLITKSLNKEFKNTIDVYIFPDRSLLDKQWQKAWNMPTFKSQCWMVGSGIQSKLDLLSPSVWDTQACDHDPKDQNEIRLLVYHELVHVLHSDYNKSPSFDDINNIDWFVEGLATFVSGQLDSDRLIRTISYVKETGGPDQLSMFWKGDHRYGLSGSMVAYIDAKYGRKTLTSLLEFNDVNDILKKLNVTEKELISNWKKALLNAK